jgi:hypothetical protein
MYANRARGQLPIGYNVPSGGAGQSYLNNFWLCRFDTAAFSPLRFTGLGLLYPAGLISESGAEGPMFYCPSIPEDTDHAFKSTGTFPNPFLDDFVQQNAFALGASGKGTRSGYSCRSSDPTRTDRPQEQRGIAWASPGITPPAPIVGWTPNHLMPAQQMRVERMKSRAIVTDIIAEANLSQSESRGVAVTHRNGINVLSADGSVRFLDVSYMGFDPANPTVPLYKVLKYTTSETINPTVDLYWDRIDAAP